MQSFGTLIGVRRRLKIGFLVAFVATGLGCVGDSTTTQPNTDAGADSGSSLDSGADTALPDGGLGPCKWDQSNWDSCTWQ
jgi:hypothetical protein